MQESNNNERITSAYYKEVGKFNIPTKEKEKELFVLYAETKSSLINEPDNIQYKNKLNKLKNEILCGYLRFVIKVAKKKTKNPQLIHDLISEGNLGLLKSIDKFDLSFGTRFLTYAAYWIDVEMQEYLRKLETVHLSSQAKKEQQQQKRREDGQFNRGEIQNTKINDNMTVSFDPNIHSPSQKHNFNVLDLWQYLHYADLKIKERLVIIYFFGLRSDPKTLEQIAELFYDLDTTVLDVKDVKHLKDKAIRKIKSAMSDLGVSCLDDLLDLQ